MTARRLLASALLGALFMTMLPVPASAALPFPNPWRTRRILNIAHQGGENEAPSDTLFALATAKEKGSDVLEIDVHATADGEIVVLHDTTVNRTTNGTGRVDALTVAQIKALDAAYWFVPNHGTLHGQQAAAYVYRGLATGAVPIPNHLAGFVPNDFTIPTLREVLTRFPDMLINIEIKNTFPDTESYEKKLADLLKSFGRGTDTIVVSFLDHATETFKLFAPTVSTATGTVETAVFKISAEGPLPGLPNPRYHAIQPPMEFQGITVTTADFIANAHRNGFAVHVWTINERAVMEQLVGWGVDGIMTDYPTRLEDVLTDMDVRWNL
jgi:glycerophosphoryl diester phosphodiesterase